MKANELRIGNLVYGLTDEYVHGANVQTEKTVQVESIDDRGINMYANSEGCDYEYLWGDLKPIPLTEQWLLNFGFEKDGQVVSRLQIDTEFGKTEIWLNKIKYVHQLQNLYFTLIGEELVIKETV